MKIADILNNMEYESFIGDNTKEIKGFSKDTRTILPEELYFAIKGETFDGNDFIKEAYEKKASCVICDALVSQKINDLVLKEEKALIKVKDSIKALQQLAIYKRSLYHIPVIAITGSAGKTSTKDMVASVIKEKYKVLKTEGNLNNHIGLPLTILKLTDEEVLVVEMGMNHPGEIRTLTKIAKPTIAVITNIGTAHIGILGSKENIFKAKLEILEGLDRQGTFIFNNDDELLHLFIQGYPLKKITYGIKNISDIKAEEIEIFPDYSTFKTLKTSFKVPIGGEHFIYNALCAISVGKELNIESELIKKGLLNVSLSNNRMNLLKKNNITIVDDTYNANYDSVLYSLKYLSNLEGRKIAVLGDMLELGVYEVELHQKLGKEINDLKIDIVITIGDLAKYINENLKTENYHFKTNEEAIKFINQIKKEYDKILIKASNRMNFKQIVAEINNS